MEERQYIFKTLDNPIRLLFWSLDEFLMMITPLFLGICVGSLFLMSLTFVVKPLYSRVKKKYPNGALRHKLYWEFPTSSYNKVGKFHSLPPSHIREYFL